MCASGACRRVPCRGGAAVVGLVVGGAVADVTVDVVVGDVALPAVEGWLGRCAGGGEALAGESALPGEDRAEEELMDALTRAPSRASQLIGA